MKIEDKFSAIFDGLKLAYGTYLIEGKAANGKTTGKAKVMRETRTTEHWTGHLSGKGQSIGIVPINENNSCKWGCIDIDQYNFDHKALIDKIRKLKLPLVVCRSKSGGAHVFLFCSEWIAAKTMQDVLNHVCSALGYGGSEIFPKQIALNLPRGDTGNFLNMPYYDQEGGLRYAFNDDGTAATLEEFFLLYDEHVQTKEGVESLTINEDQTAAVTDGPPCLQILCKEGIGEGARNNGLFNIGVYLRKAYPDDWETQILSFNMQYIKPPLPLNEVNVVAKQLQKKDYTYKCSDAPINAYCNNELCRTRKFGIGASASGVQIANLRKYNSIPPVWFLDVNGQPLELQTEDLMNQAAFQRACVEQLNFLPRTVQKAMWEQRINALLQDMTDTEGSVVEVSQDVSVTGQFLEHLEDFCTSQQAGEAKEDILLRRPWTDEDASKTYFRLKDLETYLLKQNFKTYKSHQLAQRLREAHAEGKMLKISGKAVRVWELPAFLSVQRPVSTPMFDTGEVPF